MRKRRGLTALIGPSLPAGRELPVAPVRCDREAKFGLGFDAVFRAEGVRVKPVGPAAPNLNAYAERFVQALRKEFPTTRDLHGRWGWQYNNSDTRVGPGATRSRGLDRRPRGFHRRIRIVPHPTTVPPRT